MIALERLAFVDVETTGLAPRSDRITEIGVVTADAGGVKEWTTLINPGRLPALRSRLLCGVAPHELAEAPRFGEIAGSLARRLEGRLLVAHNARFDHGFLHAEFLRAGLNFAPRVLCTAMLSRRLYPLADRHDLDAIMLRHGLEAAARHRALPDARLVMQFWRVLCAEHAAGLERAAESLLAEPVLPESLDPALVDRLPDAPGVFALLDEQGSVLHMAKAANLRLGARNYFRLDRASAKALAVAHRVRDVRWQVTRGALGAQFRLKAWSDALSPEKQRGAAFYTWRLQAAQSPCVELAPLSGAPRAACADRGADGDPEPQYFGLYETERKARNALSRVARINGLCLALLGIAPGQGAGGCVACAGYVDRAPTFAAAGSADKPACQGKRERLRQLTRVAFALRPWRVAAWPYGGPIGVREGAELHVIDEWRYLGTARTEHEAGLLLVTSAERRAHRNGEGGFERDTFAYLNRVIERLPPRRIVRLQIRPRVAGPR